MHRGLIAAEGNLHGLEAFMINHILVPLDGSTLAECVLPHVAAIAPVTHADEFSDADAFAWTNAARIASV